MEDQTKPLSTNAALPDQEGEINLMELLLVLAKHNRFIIKMTLLAAVLSFIYVLLASKEYTAKTVILPPQQESSGAGALLSSVAGGLLAGAAPMAVNANLMLGMLASRTMADAVIQRFNLQSYYNEESISLTRSSLWRATSIKIDKAGFITLQFSDQNPRLAAAIANAYIEELGKLNQTVALTNASRRRLFFENQVKLARENLANAEVGMKQTQEKTGMLALPQQSSLAIQGVANLRAEIASKEADLSAMRTFATEKNPSYQQLQELIKALRIQLSKLELNNNAVKGDVMVPTGKLPEKGLQFSRAMREINEQAAKFEFLSKQLEMARIDEAKEAVLVQVVDKAVVPEYPSKPAGMLVLIISTLLGFFLSVIMAFIKESSSRAAHNTLSLERKNLLLRYLRRGR